MNWEDLEALYWRFDAMHKGYGEWAGTPTSERDAFKRTVKQALAEKDGLYEQQVSEVVARLNDDFRSTLVRNEEEIAWLSEQVNLLNCTCLERERELSIDLPSKEAAFVEDLQRRLRLGYQFTKRDCLRVLKLLRRSRQEVRTRLGQAVLFANYLRYTTDLETDENQEAREFLASPAVCAYTEKRGCL